MHIYIIKSSNQMFGLAVIKTIIYYGKNLFRLHQ